MLDRKCSRVGNVRHSRKGNILEEAQFVLSSRLVSGQGVQLHREKKDQDRVKKVLWHIGEADKTIARSLGLYQFVPSTFTTIPLKALEAISLTVILLPNITRQKFFCLLIVSNVCCWLFRVLALCSRFCH